MKDICLKDEPREFTVSVVTSVSPAFNLISWPFLSLLTMFPFSSAADASFFPLYFNESPLHQD